MRVPHFVDCLTPGFSAQEQIHSATIFRPFLNSYIKTTATINSVLTHLLFLLRYTFMAAGMGAVNVK